MKGLNREARRTLKRHGLTPRQWGIRHFNDSRQWYGDACGCSDDRCIGYHHGPDEPCGCLPAMLSWPDDTASAGTA